MLSPQLAQLQEFLANNPRAYQRYSISDIARALNVTKQFVSLHLPGYAAKRSAFFQREREQKLRAYVRSDPDFGKRRVSLSTIAKAVGLSEVQTARLLKQMGLGTRPKSEKERRAWAAQRQRERESRVLHTEICSICKRQFDWTGGMEKRRRLNGRSVTCSRNCADQAVRRATRHGQT